jgi:hypothetical protein
VVVRSDVLPQLVLARAVPAARDSVRHAVTWIRQRRCALGGHEYRIRARRNRMFLQCAECDHETPGWSIERRIRTR